MAWHWKQTDAWYYTLTGTKKRVPLVDEQGEQITGKENREKARLALARVRLTEKGELAPAPLVSGDWVVAKVCSEYIQYCERGLVNRTISQGYTEAVAYNLNDLCKFCGALPLGTNCPTSSAPLAPSVVGSSDVVATASWDKIWAVLVAECDELGDVS